MAVRAVVFDIGGVLEVTPDLGVAGKWERELGLGRGELGQLIQEVTEAGAIGAISEEEAVQRIGEILRPDRPQLDAFMADVWADYLGTLNSELARYFTSLRPQYRTGIVDAARQAGQQAVLFTTTQQAIADIEALLRS